VSSRLQGTRRAPPVANVEDQIADNLNPIGFVIRDFHACDFLDQYYQFEAIKPVSAQVPAKISIIRDKFYIDVQVFGDESTHFLVIDPVSICSLCSLILAAAGPHDAPRLVTSYGADSRQASLNALCDVY
jgi:hypothetical protein